MIWASESLRCRCQLGPHEPSLVESRHEGREGRITRKDRHNALMPSSELSKKNGPRKGPVCEECSLGSSMLANVKGHCAAAIFDRLDVQSCKVVTSYRIKCKGVSRNEAVQSTRSKISQQQERKMSFRSLATSPSHSHHPPMCAHTECSDCGLRLPQKNALSARAFLVRHTHMKCSALFSHIHIAVRMFKSPFVV